MHKFIALDEEGFFVLPSQTRLTDPQQGARLIKNMKIDDNFTITTDWDGETVFVEPFDKPYVVQQIHHQGADWVLELPYKVMIPLLPETLVLDAWDRFHGMTAEKMPYVFSRKAQAEFFNLLEDFDDDSITLNGRKYSLPPYYLDREDVNSAPFWQECYSTQDHPWDLNGPHPALEPILPQIKIAKSRIMNFGCGFGHDAAFLASKGHIVTGVDLSPEALTQAQKTYGHLPHLQFHQGDVFKNTQTCDVILEHTLFCAISPQKRKELVIKWHQSLETQGYLLGIFFVMPKRHGPPFGCSEWELRNLLEKHFRLLYWKRWQVSPQRRDAKELVVLAQKISR